MTPRPGADRPLGLFTNPYFLMSLGILCWSGNFIVGRWASLDAPPIALSFWRHLFAVIIVLPFFAQQLKGDWPTVRSRIGIVLVMGMLTAAGNTLVYYAILYTTVVNAALINAGVPVAVFAFSWFLLRVGVSRAQVVGIFLAFTGIAIVVTRARLDVLLNLELGLGDLFMLLAILCWALYFVLLKRANLAIKPGTLLLIVTAASTGWLVPAFGIELSLGITIDWTGRTVACLAYVVLFSTILAWICINYSTLKLGPNQSSAFMCLHPVYGAFLGALFFNEELQTYHWAGTVLVLAGVILVSRILAERYPERF